MKYIVTGILKRIFNYLSGFFFGFYATLNIIYFLLIILMLLEIVYKNNIYNKDDRLSESIINIISTAVRDRMKTILTHILRI